MIVSKDRTPRVIELEQQLDRAVRCAEAAVRQRDDLRKQLEMANRAIACLRAEVEKLSR